MAYDHLMTKGSTGQLIELTLRDSANGQGKTELAPAAVTCTYQRRGAAAPVAVTLIGGTPGSWASGGWVAVDEMNRPGEYQLGIPNAALADGADGVTLRFGAEGTIDKEVKIVLLGADLQRVNLRADLRQMDGVDNAGTSLVALGRLNSAMEADGAVWRFTASALEQGPAGGGAGGSIQVDVTHTRVN